MFNPEPAYDITSKALPIRDFFDYREEFVVRPPYQRKSVWSRRKQQDLLDSLFRRFYVPKIVLREVRLSKAETRLEVIDGQQRIDTVHAFLADDLPLPRSLKDLDRELPGKRFSDLPAELRRFVDRELKFDADIIKRIDDPTDPTHQSIATEIFWRLQQGESLNTMEVAHARLSSLVRNFVVKYADDQRFDFHNYRPIDENPDKHRFFQIITRANSRMQHLALLARFLLIEQEDGPTDIRDTTIVDLIDRAQRPDGIGNESFEEEAVARAVLSNLNVFYALFKDDPMVKGGDTVQELKTEYFMISMYLLLRHLRRWYVFRDPEREFLRQFIVAFHTRWRKRSETDTDVLIFSDHRQQSGPDIEVRHRILRQIFFEFAAEHDREIMPKDNQRAFSEAQRITIYRRDEGLCQDCLGEGKPQDEAIVPWSEFEADHVLPHSRGGSTLLENGRVLCSVHNRRKGAGDSPAGTA